MSSTCLCHREYMLCLQYAPMPTSVLSSFTFPAGFLEALCICSLGYKKRGRLVREPCKMLPGSSYHNRTLHWPDVFLPFLTSLRWCYKWQTVGGDLVISFPLRGCLLLLQRWRFKMFLCHDYLHISNSSPSRRLLYSIHFTSPRTVLSLFTLVLRTELQWELHS